MSSDKPENEKPDIHEAIANIKVTMGTMAKLFERIIEDKADKPLQGDRPTGSRKRKSAQHEDSSEDELTQRPRLSGLEASGYVAISLLMQ